MFKKLLLSLIIAVPVVAQADWVEWEKDEEFPPAANILFDQNIQFYFDAEDLAVVPDVAIDIIKNKGIMPDWIGLYKKHNKK